MQRYHAELPIIRRHMRQAEWFGEIRPAGYYRKQDAHDCGNSRCGLCHPDKRFGHTPTRQELAAGLRLHEYRSE